jgi:hypothetical protein
MKKGTEKRNKTTILGLEAPRCGVCGKPMKPAVDPIAKKVTGYLWQCDCSPLTYLSKG